MTAAPNTVAAPAAELSLEDRLAAVERENVRLRKINRALMDRVERSMDVQGNAFSLFQTSVTLGQVVRDRTAELARALTELEASSRAVSRARDDAETARARLIEAIESISQGFVLFDAEDRLVLCNRRYEELWRSSGVEIRPGMPFVDIARMTIERWLVADRSIDRRDWVERRLARHANPGEPQVYQLSGDRWVQVNERRTRDGGVVAIYTDITDIKQREAERRERELAEKSLLLQSTLDNLSQGVAVFDADLKLAAWNTRFFALWEMPLAMARYGVPLEEFIRVAAARGEYGPRDIEAEVTRRLAAAADGRSRFTERTLADGRVLEMRRQPMPGGGFVTALTDITERTRAADALRDGEQRMRLITDAMPALIAYVDAELHYTFTNKAFEEWFGRSCATITGRHVSEVQGEDQFRRLKPFIDQAMAGCGVSFEIEEPRHDGLMRVARKTYIPHFAKDGRVIGFFVLTQDITERRTAEQQLREAYGTLERRVAERTVELTELNAQLRQEIHERRSVEAALREAKNEAERANLSKTRFLAAASHDLLQPLNAARLFTAALLERRMSQRNRSLATSVNGALEAVDGLLNTLLDISKLDAGVIQAEFSRFTADGLLGELAEEYAGVAQARGLKLRFVRCGLTIASDARLLSRIVRNLLSNAIRYTPQGRVLLGCRRVGDRLRIEVWDTGPGIPEDKRTVIFEEFRQIGDARPDRERGLGLGLAIVDRIARILGHRIQVSSRLGHGSVFSVEVPLAAPAAEPDMPRPIAPPPVKVLAGTTVLVIDDQPSICTAMATLLGGWSCRVVTATDVDQAIARLWTLPDPIDLIIADYHLTDGPTGVDAIETIQSLLPEKVPAMVITADHSAELRRELRLRDYPLLNKPVKPAQLRAMITHLLSAARWPASDGRAAE